MGNHQISFFLTVDEGAEAGHTWALISRNQTQLLVLIQLPVILVGGKTSTSGVTGSPQHPQASPQGSELFAGKDTPWDPYPPDSAWAVSSSSQPLPPNKDKAKWALLPNSVLGIPLNLGGQTQPTGICAKSFQVTDYGKADAA